jgi:uncharacterized membrane protein YedE/YeeE
MFSLEDVLVPIAFFAAVVLIVWFRIQVTLKRNKMYHEERMLALEKGVAVPLQHTPEKEKVKNPFAWPLALIGMGLAWAIVGLIKEQESATWSLVLIGLGAGMLIARLLYIRHLKKQQSQPSAELPPAAPTF